MKKWEVVNTRFGRNTYYCVVAGRGTAKPRYYDVLASRWFRSRNVAEAVAGALNRQRRRGKR